MKPPRQTPTDADATTPAADAPPASPSVHNPPASPGDQPPAASAEVLTPDEWARRKGLLVERTEKTPWVEPHAKGFHDEAGTLHGWKRHAYSEQDPAKAFRLSEQDYDAALKAAAEYPAAPAHAPALPPGIEPPPVPKHVQEAIAAKAKAEGSKPSGE